MAARSLLGGSTASIGLRGKLAITFMGSRRNQRLDVLQPAVEELPDRDLCGFEVEAAVQFRNQPRPLVLRRSFVASEAMPLALSLPGFRITEFHNDCPTTRRTFADMALHLFLPCCLLLRLEMLWRRRGAGLRKSSKGFRGVT